MVKLNVPTQPLTTHQQNQTKKKKEKKKIFTWRVSRPRREAMPFCKGHFFLFFCWGRFGDSTQASYAQVLLLDLHF